MTRPPRFFYLLGRARHALMRAADARLARSVTGITTTQLGALFLIRRQPDCLLKELAKGLGLNSSAVTGLAARLQRAGYIERRACEEDRRASRLRLTSLGEETVQRVMPELAELNAALTKNFTDAELEIVERFLSATIQRFEEETP